MTGECSAAKIRSRDRDLAGERVLTGLVLAGGRSTRMGADKATLVVDGQRLVDRAVATLAEVCGEVLVAAGTRPLEGLDVEQVPDDGTGPLGGIVAGLQRCTTPLLAVLAVDMPAASAEVFAALATQWTGEAGVAPRVSGVIQPLHAVYATAAADEFALLLADGERSPRRALEQLAARFVDYSSAAFAVNLNRPEDLPAGAPPARG
jgi:molybdopterin-guanine dinucleotide biosynthesis protein A